MSNDLKDILSNSNKDIDNQQLMDYLSHHLNNTQQHEVEKAMNDDAFMNDAVEGLQQMQGTKDIAAYVDQLNSNLSKQIHKHKNYREKRRLKESPLTYYTIIILLVLVVICFVVIKKYLSNRQHTPATKSSTSILVKETPVASHSL